MRGTRLRTWARLGAGAAIVLAPILLWDAARWATAPSPWDLGVRNYGALAIAPAGEWLARAAGWGTLLRYMGGNWAGWLGLVALSVAGALVARNGTSPPAPLHAERGEQQLRHAGRRDLRQARFAPLSAWRGAGGEVPLLLAAWAAGFLLLHLLTTVQVWDRYLLPLAPVLAILAGGLAAAACGALQAKSLRAVAALGLGALLLWPALTAARGGYPVGADHGGYSGLDEAFAWVEAQGPQKQLLYHNALGWNAQYSLHDALQAGTVELRWFASSTALADNAAKYAWLPRTLILPDWAPSPYLENALAQRGLLLKPQLRAGNMAVYSVVEDVHARSACTWCVNRTPARAKWPLAFPLDPTIATPATPDS